MTAEDVIRRTYEAYNRRDLDGALAGLDPRIVWDTGEGHAVRGKAAVAEHWRAEWEKADARVGIDRLERAASESILAVTLSTRDPDGHVTSRRITNRVICDGDLIVEMRVS
ncbi:MAG TPA: nuclear transport factor 2 family protein [Allosphingosinicella sp.]|nr:nuclear transport factor 2 family protein [Allosphingosinicella sp.]